MKKLLYLFAASLLVFTSCSNDDNNSSDPASSILVKKRIYINDKGVSSSEDIVYNGNKIVSITGQDGSVFKYTYTGELITKTEEIDAKGVVGYTTEYSYTNGKLATSIDRNTDSELYYKTKYIYNADGTVSYDNFRGTVATGVEEAYGATGKYTFKDGNLVKLEVSYYGEDRSHVYEYDTKNNPFKNVIGISLLFDDETAVNNIVKETGISGSGANISTNVITYSYKYDANNYPTEQVKSYPSGDSVSTNTTQYVY